MQMKGKRLCGCSLDDRNRPSQLFGPGKSPHLQLQPPFGGRGGRRGAGEPLAGFRRGLADRRPAPARRGRPSRRRPAGGGGRCSAARLCGWRLCDRRPGRRRRGVGHRRPLVGAAFAAWGGALHGGFAARPRGGCGRAPQVGLLRLAACGLKPADRPNSVYPLSQVVSDRWLELHGLSPSSVTSNLHCNPTDTVLLCIAENSIQKITHP